MQKRWPERLWIVRHGQSAGSVARDAADAAGLPEIDIAVRDETARLLVPRLQRCDAVLIGPGMLDEEAARDLAAVVLEGADGPTFVLDAGALTRLA